MLIITTANANHKKSDAKRGQSPKKQKKKRNFFVRAMRACFFVVLLLGLMVAGINIYMMASVKGRILSVEEAAALSAEGKKTQCIAVLGAGLRGGKPSPILAARLDKSMELYREKASDILLFSGDNGTNDYNEVAAMKRYAIEQGAADGIDADAIYLDYAGFSTYESMYRLHKVFLVDKAVVVTQQYHLYRALYTAKHLGIDVYGVAAAPKEGGQFRRDVREILARTKDFFYVMFDMQPKFLGEPVELLLPSTQATENR
jgi:vancomycin permeability regulator SanA